MNRLPGRSCPLETKSGNLRARHLEHPDMVFMTQLQQADIHRRKAGGAAVAGILIEDAVDDGHQATASDVLDAIDPAWRFNQPEQLFQQSCRWMHVFLEPTNFFGDCCRGFAPGVVALYQASIARVLAHSIAATSVFFLTKVDEQLRILAYAINGILSAQ